MQVGSAVFGPRDHVTTAPLNAPIGGPIESRPIPANVLADTRAKAYEIAKAEMPAGCSRLAVMIAADEIFAYLMYGRKPVRSDQGVVETCVAEFGGAPR